MTPDDDVDTLIARARTYAELQAERPNTPMSAPELAMELADELAAVRAIVDSAVTSCELGEAIAAHFGRPLPDWNTA